MLLFSEKITKNAFFCLILLLIIAYLPVFHLLDAWSLRKWDEARNAVGALNMMESGDFWVRQYDGKMDTWETKPPLLLWLQLLSMRIFGENVWAIRLPSAFATLSIALGLFYFCYRKLNDKMAGIVAAVALLVADGFIKIHVSRTGDHDALLSCWLLFSLFSAHQFLQTKQLRSALWVALFTFLAILTKSVIGILFLPAFLIFAALSGQLLPILRNKNIYIAVSILLFSVFTYYFLAEMMHKGYCKAVWEMEGLSRFQNSDGKYIVAQKWHYLRLLTDQHRFSFWFLLPFCLFFLFKKGATAAKSALGLAWTAAIFFSVVLSFGVWYDWYDAPLYPLWALIFGIGWSHFLTFFSKKIAQKGFQNAVILGGGILTICIFIKPYQRMATRILQRETFHKPNELYGEWLEKQWREGQKCNFTMLYSNADAYNATMQFYQKVGIHKGDSLNLLYINSEKETNWSNQLEIGKTYLCCHQNLTDSIQKNFHIELKGQQYEAKLFTLLARQ
ncbi:MAG: hypothetical protein RL757_1212 [Bacteroidota bacterium]